MSFPMKKSQLKQKKTQLPKFLNLNPLSHSWFNLMNIKKFSKKNKLKKKKLNLFISKLKINQIPWKMKLTKLEIKLLNYLLWHKKNNNKFNHWLMLRKKKLMEKLIRLTNNWLKLMKNLMKIKLSMPNKRNWLKELNGWKKNKKLSSKERKKKKDKNNWKKEKLNKMKKTELKEKLWKKNLLKTLMMKMLAFVPYWLIIAKNYCHLNKKNLKLLKS